MQSSSHNAAVDMGSVRATDERSGPSGVTRTPSRHRTAAGGRGRTLTRPPAVGDVNGSSMTTGPTVARTAAVKFVVESAADTTAELSVPRSPSRNPNLNEI